MAVKRNIANNKKAYHDFFVEEIFEAGLVLFGTEVKSLRDGKVNLKDSYISIYNGEAYIKGMHISPYEKGNVFNKDPLRDRKLLLHKKEIMRLLGKVKEQGYALIPIDLYFLNQKVKLGFSLARGKKLYDKREDAANKTAKRDIERAMKERNK